jgi:antitoxin (DNA-binding transcriptional repressor) of toxin-antitoxin stability system
MDGDSTTVTITATEFKAKCLSIFDDLAARRLKKVIVTRHGKPVAELTPPSDELPPLFGCLAGSVTIPEGVDLTAPTFDADEFDAEKGILYRE